MKRCKLPLFFQSLLASCLIALLGCGQPESEMAKSGLSSEEAKEIAKFLVDYDALIYNGFLEESYAAADQMQSDGGELKTLKVGISWVKNDQFAPWIVGTELGFFEEEGINLEIVEGGPGRDNLVNLIGRKIDIFIGAVEPVLFLLTSPTGADVVMFGPTMKRSSAGWVMLDKTIPNDQRSAKKVTVEDIRGKRVGVQGGGGFYVQFVSDQLGLSSDDFKLMTAGATPDALISGAMDFFQCWMVNQPRILERAGYMNWVGITFDELGYKSYNDASVVNRDFFENDKPVLAAYMRALKRSMAFLIENPSEAATITADAIDPVYELTAADVKWRMDREIPIYQGDQSEPLFYMDPNKVEELVAVLVEYGQIEVEP
ncbi:MAG: ABC transporter substrate-binding protein [Verrucomicrobiota bacterium]